MAIEGTFTVDVTTGVARIVADLGVLVVLALASDEIAGSPREGETYALMLFSTAGTLILAGADDLLVLVVGFLLASIPLYGLIGIARTPAGAESAMKTYLLGALLGILMLLGVTVLYGVTATTSYAVLGDRLADAPAGAVAAGGVGVLAGLMFKAGGVPGHFWVPFWVTFGVLLDTCGGGFLDHFRGHFWVNSGVLWVPPILATQLPDGNLIPNPN